jgi:hypothetical protein
MFSNSSNQAKAHSLRFHLGHTVQLLSASESDAKRVGDTAAAGLIHKTSRPLRAKLALLTQLSTSPEAQDDKLARLLDLLGLAPDATDNDIQSAVNQLLDPGNADPGNPDPLAADAQPPPPVKQYRALFGAPHIEGARKLGITPEEFAERKLRAVRRV